MTIKEVSEKFEMTADTLRYYEKIGLLDPVERKNGIRNYQEKDLNRIDFIKCMRKGGLSIEALLKYVELYQEGEDTVEQRRAILVTQKDVIDAKIAELQETSDRLAYKIENYEKNIVQREKTGLKN